MYNKYKIVILLLISCFLGACENPGGISDDDYQQYKELGPPKILYECVTIERSGFEQYQKYLEGKSDHKEILERKRVIQVIAGVGVARTYNSLLDEIKNECVEYNIIKSEK